jgi:hypothetical protein
MVYERDIKPNNNIAVYINEPYLFKINIDNFSDNATSTDRIRMVVLSHYSIKCI